MSLKSPENISNVSPVLYICTKFVNRLALGVCILFTRVIEDRLPLRACRPVHPQAIVALGIVVSRGQYPVPLQAECLSLLVVPAQAEQAGVGLLHKNRWQGWLLQLLDGNVQ